MSGVEILATVGNVAGNMLAKAAGGTIPARVADVMAATALAATAALFGKNIYIKSYVN